MVELVLPGGYELASEVSGWHVYPVGSRIGSRQIVGPRHVTIS